MLKEIKNDFVKFTNKYSTLNPWTNVYGLSRSIIAFSLLLTLIFSKTETLIMPENINNNSVFVTYNFFYCFSSIFFAKLTCIFLLAVVIFGYFPQITAILHWWVNLSFLFVCPLIEGGDQLNAIISFLMIPIALTDNRINHWHKPKYSKVQNKKLIIWSMFFLISIQISFVYFHAGIAKLDVEEWLNGTAVYYWATHNIFGVNNSLFSAVNYLFSFKFVVVLFTWGTIILELFFFSFIFVKRNNWNWKIYLLLGVFFHFFIIVLFGLFSFFFSMLGAIILYYIPKENHISFNFK